MKPIRIHKEEKDSEDNKLLKPIRIHKEEEEEEKVSIEAIGSHGALPPTTYTAEEPPEQEFKWWSINIKLVKNSN